MSLVKIPVPSVVGGISQQPVAMARPDKAEDIENFVPLPEVGLSRRAGGRHMAIPYAGISPDVGLKGIDIGGDEKYIALFSNDNLKILYSNGDEATIKAVTRDADGTITGGAAPVFDYLNLRVPHALTENTLYKNGPEDYDGAPWVLGGTMVAASGTGPQSPLGWIASSKTGAEAYCVFRDGGAGGPGTATMSVSAWKGRKIRVSMYVNTNTDFTGIQHADIAGLSVAFGAKIYRALWDWNGAYDTVPTVSFTSTDGSVHLADAERISSNTFRLSLLFDMDKAVVPDVVGTSYSVQIILDDGPGAGPSAGWYGWGMFVEENPGDEARPGPYAHEASTFRSVQSVATLWAANPHIPTRTSTTAVATDFGDVYGTCTFLGIAPGVAETLVPISDAGYFFVKLGAKDTDYNYRIVVSDLTGGGLPTIDIVGTVTRLVAATSDDVEKIAAAVAVSINAHLSNDDSGAGGNRAQIVRAFANGAVVQVVAKGGGGVDMVIDLMETHGGTSSEMFLGFHDDVDTIGSLPLLCQHDTRVRLTSQEEIPEDFPPSRVVLRFVADDPDAIYGLGVAGIGIPGFTTGYWEEGVEYSSTIDGATSAFTVGVDEDTLPHILVRRVDDGSGTVTGAANSVYFEWGPHTWNNREVGDDTTNPFPSFITPDLQDGIDDRFVGAVGFYKGRLVIGSGHSIALSEVARYGNFNRSTIQALPASDRIDAGISTTRGAKISDLTVGGERLFILAGESILIVTSGEFLGPRAFGLDTVYTGSVSDQVAGTPALTGFFFASRGPHFDKILIGIPSNESSVVVSDPSAEVPRLLVDPVTNIQWSTHLSSLFASSEDGASLYGHRLLTSGTSVAQSAWYRFTFGLGTVVSFTVLGTDLFILMDRSGSLELERISLDVDPRDETPNGVTKDWAIRLDRRVTEEELATPPTYAAGPDETTYTIPYTVELGAVMSVVRRGTGNYGKVRTVKTASGSTITVDGDTSAMPVFIGQGFTSKFVPLRPVPKIGDSTGVFQPVTAREVVKRGTLTFSRTQAVDVLVTDLVGTTYTDGYDDGDTLTDRELRFGVFAESEDLDVEVHSVLHRTLNVSGLEWEVELVDRGARIR